MSIPQKYNRNRIPDEEEAKKWQKIPFRIVQVSSEDEEHSVKELLDHTPFSRGWQSSRFCNYPQELLLEFPKVIKMREIQFLSHQYNIASKIEIFILPPQSEKFKKIGYLSLDNNERSNFQARELKTVYTDYLCTRVKFNLMRCHSNRHNVYSQVGLIAVSILGEFPHMQRNDDKDLINNLEDEVIYDPATLKRLKDLYKAKIKAVELEDFDEAKKIKAAIDSLKSVSKSLIQLEERKKIAIKNDDFDAAKLIKNEIDRLRNVVSGANLTDLNQRMNKQATPQSNRANQINMDNQINYEQQPNNEKLFNKQVDQFPINNDYEMDKDEDIYRIRNNINQGVQLETQEKNKIMEEIKGGSFNPMRDKNIRQNQNMQQQAKDEPQKRKIIDVDSQQVGGINLNFSQMVEKELANQGLTNVGGGDDEGEEQISAENYKVAEPLIPVLTFPIVKLIFGQQWKNKEAGFNQLSKEVNDYPHSALFGNKSAEEIVVACLGACAFVLQSNISQALLASMEMIKVLFNKFRHIRPEGVLRSDFDKYVHDCIRLLIDHIHEQNIKLKERVENTLLEFANYSLIGNKIIFEHFINGQIKKQLVNSGKHLAARYNFLHRLIQNFGYNAEEVPLPVIMKYCMKGYANPQVNVREAALQLIVIIYKFSGDKIRTYFGDLRQAQINNIEDALAKDDGLDEEVHQNQNQINDEEYYEDNQNQGGEMVNNSQMLSKEQMEEYRSNSKLMDRAPDDSEHTCQFCGLFDPNFTSEQIDIHQFKECPMLTPCFMCRQIIEISGLNYHFLNECSMKKNFKQCTRCKEAVLAKEYNAHVAEKACNPFKSPNVCNRCPLCHTDIAPAGKAGWEYHLLEQMCPNNSRTN